jgi:hypothetical protein
MLVTNYNLTWGDTSHTLLRNGSAFPTDFAGSIETVVVTWNGKTDHFSVTINSDDYSETVADPTVNKPTGTYTFPLNVTLTTTTNGATIYYTTDGTDPSRTHNTDTIPPAGAGSVPSGTVTLNSPGTLKAVAIKDGENPSLRQLVAHYYLATVRFPNMLPLTVENQLFPLTVTLTPTTLGSEIYYTLNGAEPRETESETNIKYSAPIELEGPVTLKFKAFKAGMEPSGTASAVFTQFIVTASTLGELKDRLTAADAGDSDSNPVTLPVNMELSVENWTHLLEVLDDQSKYVAMDLSDSTASSTDSGGLSSNGTFDAIRSFTTGKDKIVSLILPNAATVVGSRYTDFTKLKKISGAGITSIGAWTLEGGAGALEEVCFPNLIGIGQGGLWNSIKLKTLYIPLATSFRAGALGADPAEAIEDLTITLGPTAPSLQPDVFDGVTTRNVTIKIPSGSETTYGSDTYDNNDTTADNWGNTFRNKKSGIALTFVTY